jgi:hypothetical protein
VRNWIAIFLGAAQPQLFHIPLLFLINLARCWITVIIHLQLLPPKLDRRNQSFDRLTSQHRELSTPRPRRQRRAGVQEWESALEALWKRQQHFKRTTQSSVVFASEAGMSA